MVQNYNFFVKPQSKNQPFFKKISKTADFCHCFCITDVSFWVKLGVELTVHQHILQEPYYPVNTCCRHGRLLVC